MNNYNCENLEDFGVISTVLVDKEEYRNLIRQSEQIECLKRYIENTEYTSINDIKTIFNIKVDKDVK